MSGIRRQSIVSTLLVYIGFLTGFVNTYLFTRQGSPFSPSEYAMTVIFIAVGSLMYSFANMGTVGVIYKFYPYYNDHLKKKDNDLFAWSLIICLIGFLFVVAAGIVFKGFVVRKFGGNSPLFLKYYEWTFPFGFGLLLFTLFEAFGWNIRKPVFTTTLREVFFRLMTTLLIVLLSFSLIKGYDTFIRIYAFSYLIVAGVMLVFLISKHEFRLVFRISRVTKRFYKKMTSMAALIYASGIVFTIAQFADMLIIMSVLGTDAAGIFTLGMVVSGLVQAPQRGAIAATTPVLAKAWKDKNLRSISDIYKRSAINLLIASIGIFLLIWMSYEDIVITFKLKPAYLDSLWIFFFFGLARIVDLGTGVNSQIIATSAFWRFEFVSGVILLVLIVPLNYILIKQFGIVGAGYSNFISMTVYNVIRIVFLNKKFRMHPFSHDMWYILVLSLVAYLICHFAFHQLHGMAGIVVRSLSFTVIFGGAILFFNLTPDVRPVLKDILARLFTNRKP